MRDVHAFGVNITLDFAQARTLRAKHLECAALPRSGRSKATECAALPNASRIELALVVPWGPLSGTLYSSAAAAYGEAVSWARQADRAWLGEGALLAGTLHTRQGGALAGSRLSMSERPKPATCQRSGVLAFRARHEICGLVLGRGWS
jgi:hypothetical protein